MFEAVWPDVVVLFGLSVGLQRATPWCNSRRVEGPKCERERERVDCDCDEGWFQHGRGRYVDVLWGVVECLGSVLHVSTNDSDNYDVTRCDR